MKEFINAGPRIVRQDNKGYHVRYQGDLVYARELKPYLGTKVHVVECLSGTGYSISEWCDPTRKHPGGWWTRAGREIVNIDDREFSGTVLVVSRDLTGNMRCRVEPIADVLPVTAKRRREAEKKRLREAEEGL